MPIATRPPSPYFYYLLKKENYLLMNYHFIKIIDFKLAFMGAIATQQLFFIEWDFIKVIIGGCVPIILKEVILLIKKRCEQRKDNNINKG